MLYAPQASNLQQQQQQQLCVVLLNLSLHLLPPTEVIRKPVSLQQQLHAREPLWLRLAFDCALRRVVAFGVRDHLVDKYKLPMVPLDVCQSEVLLDVEQCIPVDFMDKFPSDTLIEVVRQKQLLVGTMDFSVFPQLAADQGYTAGFYPELVQAVAQELTVIVLQNPGLRRELVGERELDISILNQSFSKRVQDIKAAVAQELLIGAACSEEANGAAGHGLQQAAAAGRGSMGHGEALGGEGNLPWQDTLVCGDVSGSASTCQLHGCLSPWGEVPKEFQIAVTHVKFSTPMNLVAAVHRGEVHMTDVGTIASAYLPEKYNFLPLREVLEPSCTVGAWKSFFLLRDPASRRRRGRRQTSADPEQQNFARSAAGTFEKGGVNVLGSTLGWSGGISGGRGSGGRNTSPGKSPPGSGGSKDISKDRRHQRPGSMSESTNLMNRMESWEERMRRTRSLFFKLYGVQTEAATGSSQHASASSSPPGANSISPSRSADTETAFEEKTLVKLQAVDHFLYSYLFPQEFRISSVRKAGRPAADIVELNVAVSPTAAATSRRAGLTISEGASGLSGFYQLTAKAIMRLPPSGETWAAPGRRSRGVSRTSCAFSCILC
ncbi:hypothetical protein, conserved [Eimeria tenella]|uniref:Uncharacterized protein n=1 Tax=Eimeria tenella TaxID=5802 RepID=U6L4L8_EIMTE|nr:hypothetical protein, conserved [Eimeria tenella]CDJ42720.1 hypothetical protein, conserved [Eimeria tenella]|eukprot:XP_013233470.1 hypothetical protein, conserved [Eimeria tenella]